MNRWIQVHLLDTVQRFFEAKTFAFSRRCWFKLPKKHVKYSRQTEKEQTFHTS